jgi:hypothetical protein
MSIGLREEGIAAAWTWVTTELAGAPVPGFLVLLGLRDLTVLDALDRHAPSTRVLALEPDAAAARTFREDPRWRTARPERKVVLLADPDYEGADDAWRAFPAGEEMPRILVHPQLPRRRRDRPCGADPEEDSCSASRPTRTPAASSHRGIP